MPVTFFNLPNTPNAPDGSLPSSACAVNHPGDAMAAPSVTDNPEHGKNDPFPEVPLLWLPINLIDEAPRRVRRTLEGQIKERWSRKLGPVVKVDRMTRETIRNDKEKDAHA